jgi:hypothetical protein
LDVVDGVADPQLRFQLQEVAAALEFLAVPEAAAKHFLTGTSDLQNK